MRKFVAFGPGVVLMLAVLAVLFFGPIALKRVQTAQIAARVTLAQNRLDQSSLLEELNRAQRAVADAVLPGVVHIETQTDLELLRRRLEPPADEGEGDAAPQDEAAPGTPPARPRPAPAFRRPVVSSGAGWFWNDQGVIITNAHVVGEASDVKVELYDGRVRTATIVGTDPHTDIAVMRIDAGSVPPLRRATGEPISIGDRVFVFGSPFGIKFSMSQGIVSGLGRGGDAAGMVGLRGGYTNFIQTDAAMNPGNSGGPLVDIRGRVVGMATAIANNITQSGTPGLTPTQGQNAGIGFAIPLETVEAVVAQLLEADIVLRGYLGIGPGFIADHERFAAEHGFEGGGVLISEVRENEPAWDAGLRAGDIIVEIDGRDTPTFDILRSIISIAGPGTKVKIRYWRDRAFHHTEVTLGAAIAGEGFRGRLQYIPGSQHMTIPQIRQWLKGHATEKKPV